MAQNNQEFDKRAAEYLGGHARNVVNSLTGRPVEPVKPWFGEGGLRTGSGATGTAGPVGSQQAQQQLASLPRATPASAPMATPQSTTASGPVVGMMRKPGLENPAITNLTRNRTQPTVAPPNTAPVDPVTRLASGIGYQPMADGSKVYTMGTPGQDGYGKMTVRERTSVARLASGPSNGFAVSGPPDAVQRFNRPVAGPKSSAVNALAGAPEGAQSWSDWYDGLGAAYDKRVGVSPKANAATGPSMNELTKGLDGMDWRTRQAIITQRIKGADDVNIEGMREAGADRRMALAQGVELEKFKGENDIARGNLAATQEFNKARIGTEQINQQKGQAELEALGQVQAARDAYMKNPTPENESVYRALIGKFEREAQYGVMKEYDDQGNVVGERLYNKQTGDPKQLGGGQGQKIEAPKSAVEYLKKNPSQATFFKQKYGYLPEGF